MKAAICTLFEGDYHYGVGALANSLYAHGFRGTIYAGHCGPLPPWVSEAKKFDAFAEFSPVEGLALRFIPLTTKIHLTNYKPDFMLEVWEKHCPQAGSLSYFDPDIIIKCRWAFFEEWVRAGVAVCADVNPSMPANHPIRHAWKQFFKPRGIEFRRELETYFNGGFVGVSNDHRGFLILWKNLVEMIGGAVGGLEKMIVASRTGKFYCPDQDALNIAAMASEAPISPMGQDGTDLQHGGGGYVMSHAAGGKKPWKKPFLRTVLLHAAPPSRADREFFRHVESPICLFPPWQCALKRFSLLTACFLGRFMRNM